MAYRGKEIKVEDVRPFMPVFFPEQHVAAAAKDKWAIGRAAQELPELGLVGTVTKNGQQFTVAITPFDKEKQELQPRKYYYLPAGFPIKMLTGTTSGKIRGAIKPERIREMIGYDFAEMGTDPEIFLEDGKGNLLPAFKFLPDKKNARMVTFGHTCSKYYYDGFAAELNPHAGACFSYVADDIQAGLKAILAAAKKIAPEAKFSTRTVWEIDPEVLEKEPLEHIQLGCEPSLNAYDLKSKKVDSRELMFRCTGGHWHFGNVEIKPQAEEIVKTCDALVGVACVNMFEQWDNPQRRTLYGLPGEYRLPRHGIEYRTLSNAWLFHPTITNLVMDIFRTSVRFGIAGLRGVLEGTEQEVQECIRYCDAKLAKKLLERNQAIWMEIFKRTSWGIGTYDQNKHAWQTLMNGPEYICKDFEDIPKNWKFGGGWIGHCEGAGTNWHNSCESLQRGQKV